MYSWCIDAVMSLSSKRERERERPVLLQWWDVNSVIFNNANWCWLLYFMGKSSTAHKLRPALTKPRVYFAMSAHILSFHMLTLTLNRLVADAGSLSGVFPWDLVLWTAPRGSNLFHHLLSRSIIWPSNSITILNICILMSVEMYLKCLYKLTFFFSCCK